MHARDWLTVEQRRKQLPRRTLQRLQKGGYARRERDVEDETKGVWSNKRDSKKQKRFRVTFMG